MSDEKLDIDACRGRQRRLLELMQQREIDLVVVTQAAHVQWLCGPCFPWVMSPVAALAADGRLTLAAPRKPVVAAAADQIVKFDAQWHSTLRNDQNQAACSALQEAVDFRAVRRMGVEFSSSPRHLQVGDACEWLDIERDLYRLRRRKDADELAMIGRAIAATEKMYERAREIIRPGVSELEVFNELQAAAVNELGEPTTRTGNDYQCGSRGGPPRSGRLAKAGELYILDLGPAFRGYFADNCRSVAVTQVSDQQRTAWEFIMKAFAHVESTVRPGKNAQELFHEVQAILDACPVGVFNHHLGHGIGLFPHEAPHLNPNWDDSFEVGDVFTAEPGLYAPELQAGMRIENNYVVTEQGVERLTNFSMEM